MIKTSILTILTSLILASSAFAIESSTLQIVSLDDSGISLADIEMVSADWAEGNEEAKNNMMRYFSVEAATTILKAMPELKNNKRALISITMGALMINAHKELDFQNALLNIASHTEVLVKPKLTIEEVYNTVMTRGL